MNLIIRCKVKNRWQNCKNRASSLAIDEEVGLQINQRSIPYCCTIKQSTKDTWKIKSAITCHYMQATKSDSSFLNNNLQATTYLIQILFVLCDFSFTNLLYLLLGKLLSQQENTFFTFRSSRQKSSYKRRFNKVYKSFCFWSKSFVVIKVNQLRN